MHDPEHNPQRPTPPTDPPQIELDAKPPSWPKVVGVISIVLGALALLCTGVSVPLQLVQLGQLRADAPPDGVPSFLEPDAFDWVVGVAGILGTLLLIVAGGACAARASIARPLHLVYAFLELALVVVMTLTAMQSAAEIQQWAADHRAWIDDNPTSPLAQTASMPPVLMWLPILVVGTPYALWSLFLIGWFGAKGQRPEAGKPDVI